MTIALLGEFDQFSELVGMRAGRLLHHDVTAGFETLMNGWRRVGGDQRDDGQVGRSAVQSVRQLVVRSAQLGSKRLSRLGEGAAGLVNDRHRVHQVQVAQRLQKERPMPLLVGLHHQRNVHAFFRLGSTPNDPV